MSGSIPAKRASRFPVVEPFFHTLTGFSPRQFQLQTIEKLLNRQDILLRAPTGSGKTETAIALLIL